MLLKTNFNTNINIIFQTKTLNILTLGPVKVDLILICIFYSLHFYLSFKDQDQVEISQNVIAISGQRFSYSLFLINNNVIMLSV